MAFHQDFNRLLTEEELSIQRLSQRQDPSVMPRAEWFKYLKLAFDELACEYPAYLTDDGVVFVPPDDNSSVDCVDRELLSATVTMNADQVPLTPLSAIL